jgi:hypothetical protein
MECVWINYNLFLKKLIKKSSLLKNQSIKKVMINDIKKIKIEKKEK